MGTVATHGVAGAGSATHRMQSPGPTVIRRVLFGLLIAAGITAGTSLPASAAGLQVIPFPGTPDASPHARIIFPSLAMGQVASITVRGSTSGVHRGRLVQLPDGAGIAFAPARAFAPGERIHVSARLRSTASGSAAGPSAGRALSYWFGVGMSARQTAAVMRHGRRSSTPAVKGARDGRTFRSTPGLHPPTVTVTGDLDSNSGDIFVAPRLSYQRKVDIQSGPMILNSQGQLVWFRNVAGGLAMNLEVQSYQGRPVLTWWQGTPDWHVSEDVIADSSYRTLAVLHARDGFATDSHEFQITPEGTALIDATTVAKRNLSAFGGPTNGYVQDDIVQELDIKTGQVLWEWHSYGHVPLHASYTRPYGDHAFDYFHLNSIQELPDGNFLVSARDTWAIYEISRATGKIIWTLGGKDSSFKFGPGARFSWQHDARLGGGTLSLFDDASDGPHQEEHQSSAKILQVNLRTMTATLVHRYTHAPPLLAISQGNTQLLPNGNLFIDWGADPDFSEYTPGGQQIFNASFVLGVNTYRAYRFPWVGRPATPPAVSISADPGGRLTLYTSWNGATGVAVWRVVGGTSPGALSYVVRAPKTGFQTAIQFRSPLPYLAVQALDSKGDVLATSVPARNPGLR